MLTSFGHALRPDIFLVLRRHDGAATDLGEDDGAGNQRRAAGADSEAAGHRITLLSGSDESK